MTDTQNKPDRQVPATDPTELSESPVTAPQTTDAASGQPCTPMPDSGNRNTGVTLTQAIIISAIMSGLSGFLGYAFSAQQSAPVRVATVDANYLMMAHVGEMVKAPGADSQVIANQFVSDLSRVMQFYAEKGVLVINSADALNKPAGMDLTPQVAAALGISAPAVSAPAQAPAAKTP